MRFWPWQSRSPSRSLPSPFQRICLHERPTTIATINRIFLKMVGQQVKGLEKYDVTVDDANLSLEEWIIHYQQEMIDGLVYSERILMALERLRKDQPVLYALMERTMKDAIENPDDSELSSPRKNPTLFSRWRERHRRKLR